MLRSLGPVLRMVVFMQMRPKTFSLWLCNKVPRLKWKRSYHSRWIGSCKRFFEQGVKNSNHYLGWRDLRRVFLQLLEKMIDGALPFIQTIKMKNCWDFQLYSIHWGSLNDGFPYNLIFFVDLRLFYFSYAEILLYI